MSVRGAAARCGALRCMWRAFSSWRACAVVTNGLGRQALLASAVTVDPDWPQLLTSLPNGGAIAGGATVRLNGRRFAGTPTVTLGGVSCGSVNVRSATVLTCVAGSTSAGSIGTGDIRLVDSQSRDATLRSAWQYGATWVTYASVAPTAGPFFGGSNIEITGACAWRGVRACVRACVRARGVRACARGRC
jgi:hypothetical protein